MRIMHEIDKTLSKDDVLRRYLDLPKFISVLKKRALYLCRSDLLPDKYEGAFTPSLKKQIQDSYEKNNIDFTYDTFKKELREGVFLNCWSFGYDDNMAMWRLYGKTNDCVAVTTTVGRIEKAMNDFSEGGQFLLKKVTYIKHWQDPEISIKPYCHIFTYKLVGYSFENEARIILDRFQNTFQTSEKIEGVFMPVNLSAFIKSLVVSPESSSWFREVVKDVALKYGLKCPVRNSMMSKEPI